MGNPDDAAEKRRRTRLAWAWRGGTQREFVEAAGLNYGTAKAWLTRDGKSDPPLEAMLVLGRYAGIPDTFMLYGWPMEPATISRDEAVQPIPPPDAVRRDLEAARPRRSGRRRAG